ncbi:HAD-IA family hydrolase [Tardiphaga robiniae]|uniref:Haloacid dehalogenase n=1 Tax=Tardiphaga robiniae TaxID=943830 RepID=A0A161QSU7_9BRAD|nr:HAD-IA family hydrolase [Tardiphaga robiniae]KZD24534.1 haloacid dehalogenase [Tardiphaga robiniae]
MTMPLTPNSADALLFDLGRVVLDIDFTRVLKIWSDYAHCAPNDIVSRFARGDVYMRHERGEISDDAFFAHLHDTLGIDLTPAQFLEGWNAIFVGEMPGIAELLAHASKRWPLYAFSNTNVAHVTHFSEHHADLLSHFRTVFLSSSIGLRKPDAKSYEHVISEIGVPADRIVFFDDLADNIDAARACGLQAVHVTSPTSVAEALKALGL